MEIAAKSHDILLVVLVAFCSNFVEVKINRKIGSTVDGVIVYFSAVRYTLQYRMLFICHV